MWQPRFIKMQRINLTIEHLFNHFHIVEHAIIGALGNGQDAWFGLFVEDKRVGFDFAANGLWTKFRFRNRADNPVVVTRRR